MVMGVPGSVCDGPRLVGRRLHPHRAEGRVAPHHVGRFTEVERVADVAFREGDLDV